MARSVRHRQTYGLPFTGWFVHTVFQIGRPPTTAGTRILLPLEGACAFLEGQTLVILVALEAPDPAEREAVEQGRTRVCAVRTAGYLVLAVGLTTDAPADLVCRLPAAAGLRAPVPCASAASPRLVVTLCDTESGLLVAICRSALPEPIAHAIWTSDDPETARLRRTG